MRRALIALTLVASTSAGMLSCGEEAPTPRRPGWGTACVSGTYWGRGDYGDNLMHPGRACITFSATRRSSRGS